MDDFGFNNMSDDEFKKEFIKLLNMYRSGMDNFMKDMYGNFDMTPFGRRTYIKPMNEEDFIKKFFGDINPTDINEGTSNDGSNWERNTWESPDGSKSYRSFKRTEYPKSNINGSDMTNMGTMELLEVKLNRAIMDEKYEDATKIRDLINSFKGDKK